MILYLGKGECHCKLIKMKNKYPKGFRPSNDFDFTLDCVKVALFFVVGFFFVYFNFKAKVN